MLITKDGIVCERDNCSVAIEYACIREERPISIDIESETVTYGEAIQSKTSDPVVESMNHASHWLGGNYDYYYGVCLKITNHSTETSWPVTDVNVIRISGSISFYPES